MRINKINKLSKFKNIKLLKKAKIIPCVFIMSSTFSACSVPPEGYVDDIIPNSMSFSDILLSVSDKTNFDECLEMTDYRNTIEKYKIARMNKDLNKVSESLNTLGKSILKASIGDTLINNKIINSFGDLIDVEIDYSDIKNYAGKIEDYYFIKISYYDSKEKNVPGNIRMSNDIIKKKYIIKYETFDLAYNIKTCQDKNINSLEFADDIYKSYERYIFTTGDLTLDRSEFPEYNYDGVIINYYDEDKTNTLKK